MQLIKRLSEAKYISPIAIIFTLLVTAVFLLPANNVPKVNLPLLDKLVHVFIHCVLSLLWLWYFFTADKYHILTKNVFVILLVCFCYGVLIEALQHWFTRSRTFDLFDIVANGIGSFLGLFTFWIIQKKLSKKI
jgi:VanZ family protein